MITLWSLEARAEGIIQNNLCENIGYNDDINNPLDTVEILDLSTMLWEPGPSLPNELQSATSTQINGGMREKWETLVIRISII